MKRVFAAAIAMFIALTFNAQVVKIGVVNVHDIYSCLPEVEQAKAHFEDVNKQYHAELESMRIDMQKKYAQYQAVNTVGDVAEEIRKRRINELQEIDTKVQRFMAVTEVALEKLSNELFDPIRGRVAEAIDSVGAEGNFTIIYGNLSFNPVRNETSDALQPLYLGSNVIDVTAQVKEKLGIAEVEK